VPNTHGATALSSELAMFLDALDRTLPQLVKSELEGAWGWPGGMCSVASWIAGDLLREHGHGEWVLVNAKNRLNGGHDWLERGDLFYDPTAHQFEGVDRPLRGSTPNPIAAEYRHHRIELRATAAGRPAIIAMRDYLKPILQSELAGLRAAD